LHPDKNRLKAFVVAESETTGFDDIRVHIAKCEFCREFCDEYQAYLKATVDTPRLDGSAVENLANDLHRQALRGLTIRLAPLHPTSVAPIYSLAADGESEKEIGVRNLATLYSDNPEIILRLMRDSKQSEDYLQLISDDTELISNVLVQIPDIDREFVTDESGRANVTVDSPVDWNNVKWQIKIPDAVFQLEPLTFDPDKVQYSKKMLLETDSNDRIQVMFESMARGKQISLRVLELDGSTDFDAVRVSVSQGGAHRIKETRANETIVFNLASPDEYIKIRLFT